MMNAPRTLAAVIDVPRLEDGEIHTLAVRSAGGDHEARRRLIEHFIPLAYREARRLESRWPDLREEMMSTAMVEIIEAVDSFDPRRGARFITHAVTCIRRELSSTTAEEVEMIRLPRNIARLLHCEATGKEPRPYLKGASRLPAARVARSAAATGKSRAEHDGLADVPSRPEPVSAVEAAESAERDRLLLAEVGRLPPGWARVIRLRYGLDGQEPMATKDVARWQGVTPSRINQIEHMALSRLREYLGVPLREHLS